MIENRLFLIFFFNAISAFSQIKGVVKDSITGKPISYVNIWVENENLGTTSEEDGTFAINTNDDKKLVFSALGYETKKAFSNNKTFLLNPKAIQLNEVIIQKPKLNEQIVIGNYETSGFRIGLGNINSAIFFKTNTEILSHPFLKEIVFLTKSELDNAKIRVKILSVNKDNSPGISLIEEDIIISVKKGKNKNRINLENYHFKIPEDGFFISFEKLLIETNKYIYEVSYKDNHGNMINRKAMSIEPELCFVPEENDVVWKSSINGKWEKTNKYILDKPKSFENIFFRKYHEKYMIPSMKLIFTN